LFETSKTFAPPQLLITPSLAGEEALAMLEELEEQKQSGKSRKTS
jgi:hypothetical protein